MLQYSHDEALSQDLSRKTDPIVSCTRNLFYSVFLYVSFFLSLCERKGHVRYWSLRISGRNLMFLFETSKMSMKEISYRAIFQLRGQEYASVANFVELRAP